MREFTIKYRSGNLESYSSCNLDHLEFVLRDLKRDGATILFISETI